MHPILFRIGSFELYTYGAFLALAFLTAIFLATRRAEREGLSAEFVADMGIVIILCSIVGARLFFILFYDLSYTLENPGELFRLRQAGLVYYGGLIFAVLGGIVYCRLKNVSVPLVLDIAAPSVAIGQAIGRIGCFMSGCCYGEPALAPWAVKFPNLDQLRHPTQLYESFATFVIFLVLLWFWKRRKSTGQVAWLYAVLYAPARFFLEFFRGDNPPVLLGMTISQVISAAVLVFALTLGAVLWLPSGQRHVSTSEDKQKTGEAE